MPLCFLEVITNRDGSYKFKINHVMNNVIILITHHFIDSYFQDYIVIIFQFYIRITLKTKASEFITHRK